MGVCRRELSLLVCTVKLSIYNFYLSKTKRAVPSCVFNVLLVGGGENTSVFKSRH